MLFGLAAAGIPVILHLLNLRKLKTIEFSTLAFLKELQTTKIRRIKLRQWLLLVLRTLLIVAIVLAFSRPAMKGTIAGAVGTRARTTIVIILDNSMSMRLHNEHGELLKQGKELALRIVDMINEGDELFLIRTSQLPLPVTETPMHDVVAMKTMIRETQESQTSFAFKDAILLAQRLLEKSQNSNKELYVFSDFQNSSWRNKKDTTDRFALEHTRVFVARFSAQQHNIALDSIAVQTSIIERHTPVNIFVTTRNYSEQKIHDYALSIFLEGKRVAQKNISVNAWSSNTEIFSVLPNAYGWIKCYAEIESDALDDDNKRYVSFYVPESVSVAFVSENESDIHFPLLAMNASDDSSHSLFRLQTFVHSELSRINMNVHNVIVLSNVASLSKTEGEQLTQFLQRGGGVIFFPGEKTDITSFNAHFFKPLNVPHIQGILRSSEKEQSISAVENIDYEHPLFSGVFENEREVTTQQNRKIALPMIYTMLQRNAGKEGTSVMAAHSNFSLLSEYTIGEGTLLVYAIAPTFAWSDLPRRGIFVPLMYRSVMYCARGVQRSSAFLVGEQPTFNLAHSALKGTKQLLLRNEIHQDEILTSAQNNRIFGAVFSAAPKEQAGNYTIVADEKIMGILSVNIDARESDMRTISEDEMKSFFASLGVQYDDVFQLNANERIESSIVQSRYGVELWKFFVVCALVFAILEMFVGRTRKSEMSIE